MTQIFIYRTAFIPFSDKWCTIHLEQFYMRNIISDNIAHFVVLM